MKNAGISVIRYAHDILIISPSKCQLERVLKSLKIFLKTRGLTINANKTIIRKVDEGIEFLG